MVIRNLLTVIALLVFNAVILGITYEIILVGGWGFNKIKQRLDYEMALSDPLQQRLRKLSIWNAGLVGASLLMSIYFWKFY